MFKVLANRTYRYLLLAQIAALLGTGLATVALGLLAYDLAGGDAGAVLGTALAIKMVAYVGVAPVASAFTSRLPRLRTLVLLDLIRASLVVFLPFVTEVWQIYLLVFLLQSASAAFTPTFQATIPDILPDEKDYTNALSLSRLAYDLESLASPVIAASLLGIISYNSLFWGTALGFLLSAALVISVTIPANTIQGSRPIGIYQRTIGGIRLYLSTPRLRGLLAVSFASAAAGSIVLVNSVVWVQGRFGLGQSHLAFALAAFGGGSMLMALILPRILERMHDRGVMIGAAAVLSVLAALSALIDSYGMLIAIWFLIGAAYSTALTPSGRLLRRSSGSADRPSLFAAQFALSHACWLVTYPLAGWGGSLFGLPAISAILAMLAAASFIAAIVVWPSEDDILVEHSHEELPADHPHWNDGSMHAGTRHAHTLRSDDLHPFWLRTN